MKKLYTLALAALVAAGASAQNYKLYIGEDEVTDPVTEITCGYVEDLPFPDMMPDFKTITWDTDINVAALTTTKLTLTAEVTAGDGSHVQFCGLGNCVLLGSGLVTKTGNTSEDWTPQSVQLDMVEYAYSADAQPTYCTSPISGKFTVCTSASDLKTVNFTFVNESAGVEGVAADAQGGVSSIYNLQGVKMNPANLPAGVYIISNGKKSVKTYVK